MKRYYVCDVIGDGSDDSPYRAAVSDHRVSHVAVIPVGPDGRPARPWCLALAAAASHGPLLADRRLDALPDFPLDGKVSSMHGPTRTAMALALQRRGIDTAFLQGTDGYREVVRTLGRLLDPAFDENAFDVSE